MPAHVHSALKRHERAHHGLSQWIKEGDVSAGDRVGATSAALLWVNQAGRAQKAGNQEQAH
jgi:hypothetical protein